LSKWGFYSWKSFKSQFREIQLSLPEKELKACLMINSSASTQRIIGNPAETWIS